MVSTKKNYKQSLKNFFKYYGRHLNLKNIYNNIGSDNIKMIKDAK